MYNSPVFESINDVSLNDIYDFEYNIIFNKLKNEGYSYYEREGGLPFLRISELSFEEFVKHFDKPIQENPNTKYFMIINEYPQNKDKSIITYNAFKLDENHYLDSDDEYFTSESFYQKQTFDKEFDDNLLISLTDYLGFKTETFKINQIQHTNKNTFSLHLTFHEQQALNNKEDNIEYYILDVLLNNFEHKKIFVQLINDHNQITILKVFFKNI